VGGAAAGETGRRPELQEGISMVTSVPAASKKRKFVSKNAPMPYQPPKPPMAPVMGKGKRKADDPRVLRKRKRRRALLRPLPLSV
jgi:hypothetical protein